MPQKAKAFAEGPSRSVDLPSEPGNWTEFFEMMKTIDVPEDFMADREDGAAHDREDFLEVDAP